MGTRVLPGVADVVLGEDGILRILHHVGTSVDGERARQISAVHAELAAGRRLPTLIDISGIRSADRASREIAAGMEDSIERLAVVVSGPVSAVIGNFFLRVTRPRYETRIFASIGAAERWLLRGEP